MGGRLLALARELSFWLTAVLPGVARPVIAAAAVVAGWLAGRLGGPRAPLSLRVGLLLAGVALAYFILAPMAA
jgi:hypothetical protein